MRTVDCEAEILRNAAFWMYYRQYGSYPRNFRIADFAARTAGGQSPQPLFTRPISGQVASCQPVYWDREYTRHSQREWSHIWIDS